MIDHATALEQLSITAHKMDEARSIDEAMHYGRCAYSCAIMVMMLDGDLSDLPVTDWDEA